MSHIDTGQASNSPCINAGSGMASSLGVNDKTTRTDNALDSSVADIGYHYIPHFFFNDAF